MPEPRLDGLTVGLLRQAPELGDGRETEASDAAEAWVADLERLGARVVEARDPRRRGRHVAALPARGGAEPPRRRSPRAPTSTAPTIRPKLEAAQRVDADGGRGGVRRARRAGGAYEPEVDLYVSPCFAIDLPAEDADELEVRLPLSSFLRWVNLIGWAGLAVGNMQFVAPHDETVLAAGLAWERR